MSLSFRRRRAVARRRRGLFVLLVLAAAGIYVVATAKSSPTGTAAGSNPPVHSLRVTVGDTAIATVPTRRYMSRGRVDVAALTTILAPTLPDTSTEVSGSVRTVYSYDRDATVARAASLGATGGQVAAIRRAIAATIAAPVIKQRLRNNCEATALSILLATTGRRIDQLRIQRALPTSGSPDPTTDSAGMRWGDPNVGFVGRPDGGGTAGGFGVYPGPVAATARRFGAALRDLSGKRPAAVYRSLRAGHAVMTWIGLSDGPYGTWTTPSGRQVTVNFGEHTVVLHGITQDGALLVSNPLKGTRERWSQEQFEMLWARLGRRALATTGRAYDGAASPRRATSIVDELARSGGQR